jgi:exopolysaccharide biosynthesis polyprenyl glycosylphosphotransferase
MRTREAHDVVNALVAVVMDAITMVAGVLLATWVRFDSGWFEVPFGRDPQLYRKYFVAGVAAAVANYAVMRSLKLYRRPQRGTFGEKLPRLARAVSLDVVALLVAMSIVKNRYADYSNGVALLLLPVGVALMMVQRGLLFRMELRSARRGAPTSSVLVLGTDGTAARLVRSFGRDPRLRVKVAGVLRTGNAPVDPAIAPEQVLGVETELESVVGRIGRVTQIIVADASQVARSRLAEIVAFCERSMIRFNMVPDMFRLLTASVEVETVDDIPLLGISRWPLDNAWNRALKRLEDIVGGLVGLLVSAPVVSVFALLHKLESPGPAFFAQTRCGYGGTPFTIYKLRTMRIDAEAQSGPVFATKDDPRRTKLGAWMRAHNIDELPQFWNVLKGNMSLVGPRPERPVFVEQFRDDIARYMWRHACRPGITGWAQVNGFRGDTSIEERLRCDLFYIENWSLALDFKILVRTVFAMRNAY